MKIVTIRHIFFISIAVLCSPTAVHANNTNTYTISEVTKHNTPEDCYMIFENKVYDISKDRLQFHDTRYLNIDDWCGKDITIDFKDKAGRNQDHIENSYTLLNTYYIGDLAGDNSIDPSSVKPHNPYNIFVPVLLIISLYIVTKLLTRVKTPTGQPRLSLQAYKFIWNTTSLLAIIPSGVFGIYMILHKQFPNTLNINFNFLFWHVEGGILFVSSVIIHIIERLKIYFAQGKTALQLDRNKPS